MINNNPKLYYSNKYKCYAVKYNNKVEYFNHEKNEHDLKNAIACYDMLKEISEYKCIERTT